jgi:hypothetical protein
VRPPWHRAWQGSQRPARADRRQFRPFPLPKYDDAADADRQTLEAIEFVSNQLVAATGAGATQTFKVRKGSASGTVVATLTLTLADLDSSCSWGS